MHISQGKYAAFILLFGLFMQCFWLIIFSVPPFDFFVDWPFRDLLSFLILGS